MSVSIIRDDVKYVTNFHICLSTILSIINSSILPFLKERYMFLLLPCRVKRMLSNETRFERISRVFKKLSSIIAKIFWSTWSGKRHENRSFFENKRLFSKKHTCLCSCFLKLNECYRVRIALNEYLEISKIKHRP